jgi:hypothetical protein
MADEVDNNGVKINPSIFKRVKRAVFRKIVDSKIYLFNDHMSIESFMNSFNNKKPIER